MLLVYHLVHSSNNLGDFVTVMSFEQYLQSYLASNTYLIDSSQKAD